MTDKAREAIELAIDAKNALENRVIQRYWSDVDKHLTALLKATPPRDKDRVLELQNYMYLFEKMKKDFHQYVHRGNRAATKIGNKTLAEKLKLK